MAANQFGQIMLGRLLFVRPGILGSLTDYNFTAAERKWPVRLISSVRHDTITIKLPPGYTPDEIPEPVQVTSPYGSYRLCWEVKDDQVIFEQVLEIFDTLAPAADYRTVRDFFEGLAGTQSRPVVLIKR